MDVLLHNLSVCEYKAYSKRKNYVLNLGHETVQFVYEVYCYRALTRLATCRCIKKAPFRNVHSWKQS